MGLTPTTSATSQSSSDLQKASELAKKSTASLGKFQEKLPTALEKKVKAPKGKKRKFDPLVSSEEKGKNLRVLEQITSKKAKLDVTKAVGHQINSEERARSDDKKKRPAGKRNAGGGKKGQKGSAGGKKNRGNFTQKKGGKGGGKNMGNKKK